MAFRTNPIFDVKRLRQSSSQGKTLPELRNLAAQREDLLKLTGSGGIEQDKPGIIATGIDLLSRPNFAIAGAFEEAFGDGEDDMSVVSRFVNELFSGVGPLQGKKRAFGEVLERAGVGTVTLADFMPILDGTIVGNLVNLRGTVGIALDIFTDPLTYLFSGAKIASKITFADDIIRSTRTVTDKATGNLIRGKSVFEEAFQKIGTVSLTDDALKLRNAKITQIKDELLDVVKRTDGINIHTELPEFLADTASEMLRRNGSILADPTITGAAERVALKAVDDEFNAIFTILGSSQGKKGTIKALQKNGMSKLEAQAAADAVEDRANRLFLEDVGTFAADTGTFSGIPDKFIVEAGIRFGLRKEGRNIMLIRRATARRFIDEKVMVAAEKLLGGSAHTVINASVRFGRGAERAVKGTFSALNGLAALGRTAQDVALPLIKRSATARTLLHARVRGFATRGQEALDIEPQLLSRIIDARTADENFQKNVHSWMRDVKGTSGAKHGLDDAQLGVAQELARAYNSMGHDLVAQGVLERAQLTKILTHESGAARNGYLPQIYENTEELKQFYRSQEGGQKWSGAAWEPFAESRMFDGLDESQEWSKAANKIGKHNADIDKNLGFGAIEYPVLIGDFDLIRAYEDYIGKYADSITKTSLARDMRKAFGKEFFVPRGLKNLSVDLDGMGNRVYDLGRTGIPKDVSAKRPKLGATRTTDKRVKKLTKVEDAVNDLFSLDAGRRTGGKVRILLQESDEEVHGEIFRRLMLMSKTGNEAAEVWLKTFIQEGLWPPKLQGMIKNGTRDLNLSKYYGEGSVWTSRSGGIWGRDGTGMMIPEVIANEVENLGELMFKGPKSGVLRRLLDGYDAYTTWFRFGAYTAWLPSAFRDIYSNVANSGLQIGVAAMNPRTLADAFKVVGASRIGKGRGGIARKVFGENLREQTLRIGDTNWTYGALADAFENSSIIQAGRDLSEVGSRKKAGKIKTVTKARSKFAQSFTDVLDLRADVVDNQSRVLLGLANMKNGLTFRQSAEQVNEFLFDYANGLGKAEKELFRRVMPFYSFVRFEADLVQKQLRTNPGRVINQIKPFRGRESEDEYMAKWEAEGMKIRLGSDGKSVRMLNGIDLPIRSLDILWRGAPMKTVMGILGSFNPLIKTPLELVAGKDFFTGSTSVRSNNPAIGRMMENAPALMKDWMGYRKEVDDAGRPRYTFNAARMKLITSATLLSRFVSTGDRAFREYVDESGVDNLSLTMDLLTGVRLKTLNLRDQQKRVLRRRIRQMEQKLVERGAGKEFVRRYGFDDLEGLR